MAVEVTENFAGTAATAITSRASNSGASWTQTPAIGNSYLVDGSNGGYTTGTAGRSVFLPNVTPASKDQTVIVTFVISNLGKSSGSIVARCLDKNNFYAVGYYGADFELYQRVSGTDTTLGTWTPPGTGTYLVRLEVSDAEKKVIIDGTTRISYTATNALTGVGKNGFGHLFPDTSGWLFSGYSAESGVGGGPPPSSAVIVNSFGF